MCANVKRVLEVLCFDSLGNELSEEVGPLTVNVEFDVMSWLGTGFYCSIWIGFGFLCNSLFFLLNKNLIHGASQHPEPFGVSDGLQEPFLQLLLGRVLRQQQGVKAGVRGRQPGRKNQHRVGH